MEFTVNPKQIFEDFKQIFSFPGKFFEKSKKYRWQDAVSYLVVVTLIGNIISYLYYFSIYPQLNKNFPNIFLDPPLSLNILEVVQLAVYSYFVGILMSFVWAGLFMLVNMLFTKKKDFGSSYKAIAYARTPIYLLGWAPLLTVAAWVYTIYLLIVSITKYYEIKFAKALAIVLISFLVLAVVAFYLLTLVFNYV